MNLTTATRYKLFAGITGSSQDTLITQLLPMVSAQIAQFLRRDLEVTSYKSWVNGSGSSILRLQQWPILQCYLVSLTTQNAGYIQNTSSTVSRATVNFDGATLTLAEISTSGTETLTEKTASSNKTISAMKTVVDATSGWAMTVASTDYNGEPSAFIRPINGRDALASTTADVDLPGDPVSVKIVDVDVIELTTGGPGAVDTRFTNDITPFSLPRYSGGIFPSGFANVFVWYKAGYTLPTDASVGTLPAGLEWLAQQIMQDAMSGIKLNSNLSSESLGDYSYSLAEVRSAIENRKKDLMQYRRVTV